jgi:hypothetical protein
MAPQTALILVAGWFIGAIAFALLPRGRSIRWKLTAIAGLLLAFSIEAAILAWYYPPAR